jgi:hypoxanthine phosphoribosyltransferase
MPTESDLDPNLILFTPDQIRTRVAEMAAEIRHDIPGSVHFVTVLKGAVIFLADLIRCVEGDVTLDFMSVSSYGDATTSGEVRVLKDLDISLTDKDVVLVEDIVDTGVTLTYLHTILRTRHPRSLRTACLLSKPSRRMINVPVEYVGFTIKDQFVAGYGLDHAERFRHLPHIRAIEPLP